MKIRMTFMMILVVFSGVFTNVYGESQQRWREVPARVLTSYDFLEDPDLVAHNDDLVLIFLDAAQIPEMSIPYENSQTHTRTICWDQEGSSHTAGLIDEYGDSIFTLGPGECVSPTLEAGFYTLNLYHDGTSKPATFVLRPTFGEGGGAETGVSANYSPADLDQLKNTNQCPGCNLYGADLSGADLRDADLRNADLGAANLSGAKLSEADLRGAYLSEADLRGAYLSGAHLYLANLRDADLSGADLSGADLNYANLTRAKLIEADLSGASLFWAYLRFANLSGADLSGAVLARAYLRAAKLMEADLSGASLGCAYLQRANLKGADLRGAHLRGADLNSTKLSEANLSNATWVDGSQCGNGSIGRCIPVRPN
jgi:uncharacterized protein YjbI with pentapeptide repeats